jgi:ribonuclease BN (tRNA processing enzyme)
MLAMVYLNLIDIDKAKPLYIFISHLHLDHIEGLHIMPKLFRHPNLANQINILTEKRNKKNLEFFLSEPFTVSLKNYPVTTNIIGLESGIYHQPFHFQILPLIHVTPSHGIQINIEEKRIAYCADTGYTESAIKLADKSDFLIHECSFLTGNKSNWGHTNPIEAAEIAKRAQTKKLVLIHFDASIYTDLEMRRQAEKQAQKIFPASQSAYDELILSV